MNFGRFGILSKGPVALWFLHLQIFKMTAEPIMIVLGRVSTDWGKPMFTVKDNGNGMNAAGLKHMLRIGHKPDPWNKEKLGKYGVGFKQGSMRIGENALVISRQGDAVAIGLVSQ
eukprot:scaffold378167_cov19-Prasinocladus_malaysianus.AAC.1